VARDELERLSRKASDYFRELQGRICSGLEELERIAGGTTRFRSDSWEYHGGGGGVSCVIVEGTVFEKAGVNFSRVTGNFSDELATSTPGKGTAFTATGISLVLHPRNPHVPAVHANFRHILKGVGDDSTAWFGGGSDLTPYYPRREDVIRFHRVWKAVCDRHSGIADHARFKKWCDEYFYLPHRRECRGVGGIFFDYLSDKPDEVFAFVQHAGDQFLSAYAPIVESRWSQPWTDAQRRWQLIRRGRYVEFNLLYDRGTMFGLKTGGRVESILMSMPPLVMWGYDERAAPNSAEAELLEFLRPRDWASET
jgi:coproporphyrinogen III oxidase